MTSFEPFTPQHYVPILFLILVTGILVMFAKKSQSHEVKKRIGLVMALITWGIMFAGSVMKMVDGSYSIQLDLPLFMCRLVAWVLPVAIFFLNRKWLKVLYFYVLAGTIQAVISPDLEQTFPSYEYIRYFVLHVGLISTTIYMVIVFQLKITWKDLWFSFLIAQPYLLILMGINKVLGSNYGYTMHKPPTGSVLDFFGPWPWYILGAELLMLISFLLLITPFVIRRKLLLTSQDIEK